MHESECSKLRRWVPFAWMPNYDEAKANRPLQGYDSSRSRRSRLELQSRVQCLAYVFADCDERTAELIQVVWGRKIVLSTKLYLGAVVVDHPHSMKAKNTSWNSIDTFQFVCLLTTHEWKN
jgi:hypothetical protein